MKTNITKKQIVLRDTPGGMPLKTNVKAGLKIKLGA